MNEKQIKKYLQSALQMEINFYKLMNEKYFNNKKIKNNFQQHLTIGDDCE